MIVDSSEYAETDKALDKLLSMYPDLNFNDLLSRLTNGTGIPVVVCCCLILNRQLFDRSEILDRIKSLKCYYNYTKVLNVDGEEV